MSHNHGNKKANTRRKRNTGQGASKPVQPNEAPHAAPQPTSPRATRKEAARAQAKKKRQMQLLIGGLAAVAVIIAVVVFINRPTNTGVSIDFSDVQVAQSEVTLNPAATPLAVEDGKVTFATGSTVGDPNAPVTMHIYSDFQCHFCKIFHEETLPLIVDDFVRTGQVKLVFHDFPRLGTNSSIADPDDFTVELLDTNNESSISAQAAMCAAEQDEYLDMTDRLFANFSGVQSGGFSRSNVDRIASDVGLDTDAFGVCMDSQRHVPTLAASIDQGMGVGITATPMFILDNGSGEPNVIQQTAEGYNLIKRQIEVSIQTAP